MANCPEFYSREISILQQSQSKLALDFLTNHGIVPTSKELWSVTEVFVQCCLHKQNDDLKKRLTDLDKWIEKRKTK
jgi:phage-related protein